MPARFASALGSAVFLVIAPGTIAGWIPWWISGWVFEAPFFGLNGWRLIGTGLVVLGAAVLSESFARFALVGRGTPAPVLPTERLVVSGLYRYVRNPMYLAVLSIILGQALLFGSRELLWYAALVGAGFHAFVLVYEEPSLRARYGAEYEQYRVAVPRWRPRFRAYTPWTAAGGA